MPALAKQIPLDAQVYHLKQPNFPQFRFEFHTQSKRVYLIRLEQVPLMGDPIAFEVTDYGMATNCVLIWLRGYREAKAELSKPKKEPTT